MHIEAFETYLKGVHPLKSNHISLYRALYTQWKEKGFPVELKVDRDAAKNASGISSFNTYVQCLKDLEHFGHITYKPGKAKGRPAIVLIKATWL